MRRPVAESHPAPSSRHAQNMAAAAWPGQPGQQCNKEQSVSQMQTWPGVGVSSWHLAPSQRARWLAPHTPCLDMQDAQLSVVGTNLFRPGGEGR